MSEGYLLNEPEVEYATWDELLARVDADSREALERLDSLEPEEDE